MMTNLQNITNNTTPITTTINNDVDAELVTKLEISGLSIGISKVEFRLPDDIKINIINGSPTATNKLINLLLSFLLDNNFSKPRELANEMAVIKKNKILPGLRNVPKYGNL